MKFMKFIKQGIKRIYSEVRAFTQIIGRGSVGAYSAAAAFFAITSFFPFMLLLMTLVRNTPLETHIQEALSDNLINTLGGELLAGVVSEISETAKPNMLFGTFAGLSALWAASRCVLSVIQGLNKVCGKSADSGSKPKKKSWLKQRAMSLIYVVVLQVVFIAALGVLVFGDVINTWLIAEFEFRFLGVGELAVAQRWVVGFVLLIAVFLLAYTFVPDRKTKLRRQLPGAALAAAGWLGFSWVFAIYIDNFANFGAVYGSLATVVILMLWLYFCMFILFTGAAVDSIIPDKSRDSQT
jgi:membrane protein